MFKARQNKAIVLGVSAGGLKALEKILTPLPRTYDLPIIVVQHRADNSDEFLARHLDSVCKLQVKEAEDKEKLVSKTAYIAPSGYHLLLERNKSFALSLDPLVNWSRPSIDVLFETAAEAYQNALIGIILTGANQDGSQGLCKIKQLGGLTIVQDPEEAFASQMPLQAIARTKPDYILPLNGIVDLLQNIALEKKQTYEGV